MNIAFVYTGITSYMTDCWRALSARADIKCHVWIEDTARYRFKGNRDEVLRGINASWKCSEDITESWLHKVETEIEDFKPDVVFVCGWARRLPPFIRKSNRLKDFPMVLMFDMPWEFTVRKIAARFVLRHRLKRFCMAFVPGKSTAAYARWLGFGRDQIVCGEYSINLGKFANDEECRFNVRSKPGAREGFLFLGRHAKEKGLDVLEKGHALYKKQGGKWSLTVPDFIEPADVPSLMRKYSCLILPSRWEPWGVVVLEAMAAGMKVIVSDSVGSRLDLPVDEVFKSGDSVGLAEAMLRVEKSGLNPKNVDLSRYSAENWTRRVIEICERCRT